MPVTTKHPQYEAHEDEWRLMGDSLDGERAIKRRTTEYLPKTAGQVEAESMAKSDETDLTQAEAAGIYQGYLTRAEYPLWVKDSLRTMMGLVSRQEPEIKLPPRMQGLLDEATADGFGLKQLFLRVVAATLTRGRSPLMAEFDDDRKPYIAQYTAETAINWKEESQGGRRDLTLAVFEEQREKEDGDEFSHDSKAVYRVLDLPDGQCRVRVLDESGTAVEDETTLGRSANGEVAPLGYLPIVYVGSTDNNPDVDEIPLLSMAKSALKYYQLSADYYTSLHYTAHPQPWVAGLEEDKDLRVTGPMAAWVLPPDGKADYLEFTGAGIEATRTAMTDQRNAALEAGARVIDVAGAESGEARRARQDDQHASLYSVVVTAAEGIEQVLKYIADWMGATGEVVFRIVPKFNKEEVDAAMMQIIANMVLAGEVPRQVLFDVMRKAQLTELTDDQLEALRDGGDGGEDDVGTPPGQALDDDEEEEAA